MIRELTLTAHSALSRHYADVGDSVNDHRSAPLSRIQVSPVVVAHVDENGLTTAPAYVAASERDAEVAAWNTGSVGWSAKRSRRR